MKYTPDEIKNITDNASVLDYFLYLERSGKVKFERKSGKDYYFRTEDNKFSVSEKKWYDFKTQLGGGAIKAIMSLENKSWKESIDFLKEFNNISLSRDLSERKAKWRKENENKSSIEIQKTLKPNNGNLIDYFAERGIDRDILEKYTLQVHYKINDKYYFGIGIKNESNGFEIRNPYAKTKVGASDISVNYGEKKDEIMVFEGMTNMLSFLQIQKNKGLQTKRTLVTLNSVTNSDKFLDRFKSFSGKVFLALDNDKAGEEASNKIIAGLPNAKVKDIRFILGLEHKEDLNDYLLKNFDTQKNIHNLDETNKIQNEYDKSTQTTGISPSQSMGSEAPERNNRSFSEDSQSEQRNNGRGQKLGSNNVGDGLGTPEQISLGRERGDEGIGTATNAQSKNDTVPNVVRGERSGQTNDSLEFREGTLDRQSGNEDREPSENDNEHNRDNGRGDNVSHRENISIRGRLNNEEISEIINSLAYVSEGKKIILKDNIATEQAKEVASQFKSGGITKDGRGVLDEYYTDSLIVDAVRNLIKDLFKGKSEISVLSSTYKCNFLGADNKQ